MSTLTATLWRDDRFEFQALAADGVTPRSLAGCSLFFGVRLNTADPLLIAAALEAGITITDIPAGRFSVLLAPIAKIGLNSLATYYWDIVLVDAAGAAVTPPGLSGTLTVVDSATPPPLAAALTPPANGAFRPEVLTLTGGTATALDGLVTTTLPRPYVATVSIDDDQAAYKLRARGESDPLPDSGNALLGTAYIYPADYDAETNDVLWVRIN